MEETGGLSALEKPPPSSHTAPSSLHNFIFPSPDLRWGAVRLLRCMKEPIVNIGEGEGLIKEAPSTSRVDRSISPPKESEDEKLPWNLRRRRSFSKGESSKPAAGAQRKEKRKLTVPLSFKEIEADFLLMTGKKPHKRPKKRPRHAQKEVDAIVPGLRLSVVTFDMYKVVA